MKIKYNPKLKERARDLRKNATFAEKVLWQRLRGRQILGYQFMRQKPVGNYIVDFYCSSLKLGIEVDGGTHHGKQEYDNKRENRLTQYGLTVLRFDGFYVTSHITEVLEIIGSEIEKLEKNTTP